MKKKILFVITKSNFGGAQKYVYDLAKGLEKDKFEVAVAVGGSGILVQKLLDEKIRVVPISALTRDISITSDITAFFELWSIIRREKPYVVHLNSAKAGGVGALAARLAFVPKIIFTAHGWAFNEARPSWQCTIIKFFSWFTTMLSHKTIAVSDAVKNDTKSWPLVSGKIAVIKNGIEEPEFYSRKKARGGLFSRINVHIPENAFVVGTIAELHKNKGLSYAVEAFAKLIPKNPNFYYFIIGDGEEKNGLDALINKHGLKDHVFLLGFVDEASRFLKAFDLFLLPSITEGLALVLLEAGLARLPVIASRVGGIPEVILDNKTGLLVPARDPDAIAEAVKKLVDSGELREKLGSNLLTKVSRDFYLTRVISETISLYERKE